PGRARRPQLVLGGLVKLAVQPPVEAPWLVHAAFVPGDGLLAEWSALLGQRTDPLGHAPLLPAAGLPALTQTGRPPGFAVTFGHGSSSLTTTSCWTGSPDCNRSRASHEDRFWFAQ